MSYIRIEATPPTPYGLGWFYVEAINGYADEQYVGNLSSLSYSEASSY
jgi:hypothetical protein